MREHATHYIIFITLLTMILAAGTANAYTWDLDAAEHVTSGYPADQAVSGDFNHDGYPDLAFVSKAANNVSVMLGQPPALKSWSLGPAVSYPTGDDQSNPRYISSGDFDKDGNTDLVISNSYLTAVHNGSISVAMGNGKGAFGSYTSFGTTYNPKNVGVADFNRDGRQDIVVVSGEGPDAGIYVYLNTGGSFKPYPDASVVHTQLGTYVEGLSLGDYNGDGKVDAAVGYHDDADMIFKVALMLGDGAGGFSKSGETVVGDWVTHLACGDLNLDGKLDIVAPSPISGKLTVFLGDGEGGLGTGTDIALDGAHDIAVTDLDGDGKPDLVVANPDIYVLTGNGDGTFNSPQSFTSGLAGSPYLLITDINRDSIPDVITDSTEGDGFELLTGSVTGRGGYGISDKVDYATTGNTQEPVIADFDRDGNDDVVVVDNAAGLLSYFPGIGDGTFGTRQDITGLAIPQQACVADFDRDGNPDIAVTDFDHDYVTVFHGDGAGHFSVLSTPSVPFLSLGIISSDFNNDGKPDLAVTYWGSRGTPGTQINILLGDGNGGFTAQPALTSGLGPFHMAAGDFNHDGKLDLAVTHYWENTVGIFIGNGDGSFQDMIGISAFAADAYILEINIGDIDRDGKPDILVLGYPGHVVYFIKGSGDGMFSFPVIAYDFTSINQSPIGSAALADLNWDGKLDFVTSTYGTSHLVNFAMGDGAGGFGSLGGKPADNIPKGAAVADFNHDGFMDIVAPNYRFGAISVYLGREARFHLGMAASPDTGGNSVTPGSGDYDPDTVVDIAATPGTDYYFINWSGDTVADPNNATTTITMDTDKSVTANFGHKFVLTTDASPADAGSVNVTETGPYMPDTVVHIEAAANPGWKFDHWSGDTVADPNNATTTITMDTDKSVTANFAEESIDTTVTEDGKFINVSAVYRTGVNPAPDGTVLYLYRRYRSSSAYPWPERWPRKGSAIVSGGAGGAVFTPKKVKNGEYQFRVGYAPKGVTPIYSNVTEWNVNTVVLTTIPVTPSLDQSPAVAWQEVPGAIGYYVQTSAVRSFTPLLASDYRAGGSNTSGNLPALPAGARTFWRVVAVLGDGVSTAIPSKPKKIIYTPVP